jgi:hypothetical protein
MDRTEQENRKQAEPAASGTPETTPDETVSGEETGRPDWLQTIQVAFNNARREHKPVATRGELGKDKSKSMFILVAAGTALLLVFFGLFSSPKKRTLLPGANRGQATLGRKVTEENATRTVTPILDADTRTGAGAPGGEVTPEDVGRTSRFVEKPLFPPAGTSASAKPSPTTANKQEYALNNVDFSDPALAQPPGPPPQPSADLKKPSIVFVRSTTSRPALPQQAPGDEGLELEGLLPTGTRLVARIQAPVSSAARAPVVAVIEYNYERDGEIVLPAGAKAIGKLAQVNASGIVGIQFDRVEMPDGSLEKLDGTAMDLKFGPLKGYVSGRRRGTRFLVRSMTGLGTVAAYMVGSHGSNGFNGPISDNALLRERLAENVGTAGQEELNELGFNQNIVVTVPGNTRFYIVVQKGVSDRSSTTGIRSAGVSSASLGGEKLPTLEELRELMQLRREVNQMYQQASNQTSPQVSGNEPQQ